MTVSSAVSTHPGSLRSKNHKTGGEERQVFDFTVGGGLGNRQNGKRRL